MATRFINNGFDFVNFRHFLKKRVASTTITGTPTFNNGMLVGAGAKYKLESLIPLSGFTIELKAKVDATLKTQGTNRYMLATEGSGYIQLYHETGADKFMLKTNNGGSSSTIETGAIANGDVWFQITANASALKLYTNGTLVNTVNTPNLPVSANYIYIGSDITGSNLCGAYLSKLIVSKVVRSQADLQARASMSTIQLDSDVVQIAPLVSHLRAYKYV